MSSAHAPSQSASPAEHAQAPATQDWSAGHAKPHAPQFASSSNRTHAPRHASRPGGHAHVPSVHAVPSGQAFPHAPQFALSSRVSRHVSPQRRSPSTGQAHRPRPQTWSPSQTIPHAPQCAGSSARFTHCPAHSTSSVGHPPHATAPRTASVARLHLKRSIPSYTRLRWLRFTSRRPGRPRPPSESPYLRRPGCGARATTARPGGWGCATARGESDQLSLSSLATCTTAAVSCTWLSWPSRNSRTLCSSSAIASAGISSAAAYASILAFSAGAYTPSA